jgi:hypothetical protein
MLTQTTPSSPYSITASIQLIGPLEKIINEPKRLTRLKNCLSGLPLKIDLHTTSRGEKQLLFTAAPSSFSIFTRLAHQLANESTAFVTSIHISQPTRTLADLNPDDWVIFNNSLPPRITHDSNALHAGRIPANLHFIAAGTAVSAQALAWLKSSSPKTFDALPLENLSPITAPDWFLLAPHHFLGPGLHHPFLAPTQTPMGIPQVTIGISPSQGPTSGRYLIDQKRLHESVTAHPDAAITDPALLALAQVTLNRTLTLSSPITLLRSQIPANTDIAWFHANGQPALALKVSAANALIATGLLTPDLLTPLNTLNTPPQGSTPITTPPPATMHPLAHRAATTAPISTQEKITTPTLDHAAKALSDFAATYRPPNDRPWRARSRRYPLVQVATLPANWVALAGLPGADGLLADILQNAKHFKGDIQNPGILPPHSRLIEVATDSAGGAFILIAPPDAPSLSSLGQIIPAAPGFEASGGWIDCPVAWHEGNKIVCLWPSIIHFALDRIAENRLTNQRDTNP